MREARIDGNVLAIDYRWLMGGTGVLHRNPVPLPTTQPIDIALILLH